MEKSKLISSLIAKLKIAYPYYFKDLDDESLIGLVALYQENISDFNEPTLTKAINSIIKQNKFMPSIKEILDECERNITHNQSSVVEKMIADGYFKNPGEIEKTYNFIEAGIIPSWLLDDMKKYGYDDGIKKLDKKEALEIGEDKK